MHSSSRLSFSVCGSVPWCASQSDSSHALMRSRSPSSSNRCSGLHTPRTIASAKSSVCASASAPGLSRAPASATATARRCMRADEAPDHCAPPQPRRDVALARGPFEAREARSHEAIQRSARRLRTEPSQLRREGPGLWAEAKRREQHSVVRGVGLARTRDEARPCVRQRTSEVEPRAHAPGFRSMLDVPGSIDVARHVDAAKLDPLAHHESMLARTDRP